MSVDIITIEMKSIIFILFLFVVIADCNVEWWQKAVIYQVYPRSFKDSNGDGVGDINGIRQGLPYLKETGIEAVWISPIYESPMSDFGYDISNYRKIHREYGTMNDFDNLIKEANEMGIYVIMDFVPNHCSVESDLFKLSANRTEGYEDYFIWENGRIDPNNLSNVFPPNNWISVTNNSAWEYNSERGQFYLHNFGIFQADFNYRNPDVVAEMKDVLRFWLNKGVAGFRVDAVSNIFEADPDNYGGVYPNEPLTHVHGSNPDSYNYLDHIYTTYLDETFDMVYQWRSVLDEFTRKDKLPRVMLLEIYTDVKQAMRFYGNATHKGAQVPFNLQFLFEITQNSDARDIKYTMDKWLIYMPTTETANWINGNHDQSRLATRIGPQRVDAMNTLALILPGVALTYQGEELGMTNGEVSWEQTKDPLGCNTNDPENYNSVSRDPERTPFHWDDSKNAGFSIADVTWLPVAANYRQINVKVQSAAAKSHYNFYKDLVALRKSRVLNEGDTITRALSPNVLTVVRYISNEMIVGVINLGSTNEKVNLRHVNIIPQYMTVYSSGINSNMNKGARVDTSDVSLAPNDAVVFI